MSKTQSESVCLALPGDVASTLGEIAEKSNMALMDYLILEAARLAESTRLPKGESLEDSPDCLQLSETGLVMVEIPVTLSSERKGELVRNARNAEIDYICPLEELSFLLDEVLNELVSQVLPCPA